MTCLRKDEESQRRAEDDSDDTCGDLSSLQAQQRLWQDPLLQASDSVGAGIKMFSTVASEPLATPPIPEARPHCQA